MMMKINYQKRKNEELFRSLEKKEGLFLSKLQNYIPIYKRFFSLTDKNYNSINLNNRWYLSSVTDQQRTTKNVLNCQIKNMDTNETKEKPVFFKIVHILDPFKYVTGKYNIEASKLFNLPTNDENDTTVNSKILDNNNSAYVDGLFVYISSLLIKPFKFVHGVDYYGSFLGIKNDYKLNAYDDIDFLQESEFFNNNKNKLFKIDEYEHLLEEEPTKRQTPIIIDFNSSFVIDTADDELINEELFDNIFDNSNNIIQEPQNLDEVQFDINEENTHKINTLSSSSSCSSRTSHTNSNYSSENEESDDDDINAEIDTDDENEDENEGSDESTYSSNNTEDEEEVELTIPEFPVQIISMENCEKTFDDLIINNELTTEEWHSALMQIIMILITYQKCFSFTHNDLHTNNVMYNKTNKKFLYYRYNKKQYKVPTYGKLFKIIDFGRSIYKVNGLTFCSDSFKPGNDAATQYNTEPYFNETKPRLEPNFSFDLCRLACSIFDYIIDDIKHIDQTVPIQKLINEWCQDDNNLNMLYKNNGQERYPDFKLYKMIARQVHNHTPQAQLLRPEFNKYSNLKDIKTEDIIDIDSMPNYTNF